MSSPVEMTAHEDPVDGATLARLEDDLGSRDALQALIRVYLDQLAQTVATIESDAHAGACADVAGSAHRLKSSTALLGATELARLSSALEEAGKAGDAFACRELASRLGPERDHVEASLTAELARDEG
jgi:HPt (histidine-containing phosphotransfer) domain-containing protein